MARIAAKKPIAEPTYFQPEDTPATTYFKERMTDVKSVLRDRALSIQEFIIICNSVEEFKQTLYTQVVPILAVPTVKKATKKVAKKVATRR